MSLACPQHGQRTEGRNNFATKGSSYKQKTTKQTNIYQLYDYFVVNNLLSQNQFGFRQFHSTASALLDSTNEWFINMDRGQFNIAVFLDLQKAFDTINHNILIKKLDLYGLQKPALNLLGSYLENRFQMCTVNGVLSKKI